MSDMTPQEAADILIRWVDDVQSQNEGLKINNDILHRERIKLQAEMDRAEFTIKYMKKQISGSNPSWANEDETSKLRNKNSELKEENRDLRDFNNELQISQISGAKELLTTQGIVVGLRRELERLKELNPHMLDAQVRAQEKEINQLKSQWKGQCTLVDTLNEKIKILEGRNDRLSNGYTCITREEYENKICDLETKITNLTSSRDSLKRNNSALNKSLKEKDLEISTKNKIIDKLQCKNHEGMDAPRKYTIDEYVAGFPHPPRS